MGYTSNCWLEARREYRRRVHAWRRDPVNNPVPYYTERPCYASGWISHFGVGRLDEGADAIRPSSFKPEAPKKKLRWWQLPLVALFRGRWVSGEAKDAAKHRAQWLEDHDRAP